MGSTVRIEVFFGPGTSRVVPPRLQQECRSSEASCGVESTRGRVGKGVERHGQKEIWMREATTFSS